MRSLAKIVITTLTVTAAATSCGLVAGLSDRELGESADGASPDVTFDQASGDTAVHEGGSEGGGNDACASESDQTFCADRMAACGTVTGNDNCGRTKTVTCGTCSLPQTCGANNQCACAGGTCPDACTP